MVLAAFSETPIQSPWNHSVQLSHPLADRQVDRQVSVDVTADIWTLNLTDEVCLHHETVDVWFPADTVNWSTGSSHGDLSSSQSFCFTFLSSDSSLLFLLPASLCSRCLLRLKQTQNKVWVKRKHQVDADSRLKPSWISRELNAAHGLRETRTLVDTV